MRDDHFEVFNYGIFELAFVHSKVELVLLQEFHDLPGDPLVLLKGLHEDEDVV